MPIQQTGLALPMLAFASLIIDDLLLDHSQHAGRKWILGHNSLVKIGGRNGMGLIRQPKQFLRNSRVFIRVLKT